MPGQSRPKIIVVGAGIIGAVAAWQLQTRGADVTVVDAGGARATDASFGWINASFYADSHHHHLRVEAIAAYHRLMAQVPVSVTWCGSLCWDGDAALLEAKADVLRGFGYLVEVLDAAALQALEPSVGATPERVLRFPSEGVVEQSAMVSAVLTAAMAQGARVVSGIKVEHLELSGGRVVGVHTATGRIAADQVLVAAGVGTPHLLAGLDLSLPMRDRPALVLRTRPVAPSVKHVLATDIGDIRQLPDGALMMPASVNHQADASEIISGAPQDIADAALDRLRGLFPSLDLEWAQVTLAYRPVPGDGLPAVGAVAEGLYAATLHSGVTLAAMMGELIAEEMLDGPSAASEGWLAPYRLQRFQA